MGTGRLIFSLNYTEADFEVMMARFVAAARAMDADGWWFDAKVTNKAIKRRILREMIAVRLRRRQGRGADRPADLGQPG